MSDKGENEGGAGTAASDMSTPDAKEELETKTRDFISSVVDLAKTEASQTKDELQVLEQMNTVAASEYAQIADTVKSISSFRDDLLKKHQMLAKHIEEIDKIDKSTIELEHVVGILDEYTKRLEAKAKPFYEREKVQEQLLKFINTN